MAKQYISLQGKLYLSPIVAGVAGAARHVGNAPDFEIELDGERRYAGRWKRAAERGRSCALS